MPLTKASPNLTLPGGLLHDQIQSGTYVLYCIVNMQKRVSKNTTSFLGFPIPIGNIKS